jgi:hypothetical protein
VRLWTSALLGAAVGVGVQRAVGGLHPVAVAVAACGSFGALYLAATLALGVPEARVFAARLASRLRRA